MKSGTKNIHIDIHVLQKTGIAYLHAVIVSHGIADGVNADVSHVEGAGRVRKHGEHIHGLLVYRITLFLEVISQLSLPLQLDLLAGVFCPELAV